MGIMCEGALSLIPTLCRADISFFAENTVENYDWDHMINNDYLAIKDDGTYRPMSVSQPILPTFEGMRPFLS